MPGKKRHSYRPRVEALEDRQLLAASVSLQSGVLTILGSRAADLVAVVSDGSRVVVTEPGAGFQGRTFPADAVNRIVFQGRGGNDMFINNTGIPSEALGGPGRDMLQGGLAVDRLFGGPGRDILFGLGNDVMNGGSGTNRILSTAGSLGLAGLFGLGGVGDAFAGPAFFPGASGFGLLGNPSLSATDLGPFVNNVFDAFFRAPNFGGFTSTFDSALFRAPNFSGFNTFTSTDPTLSGRDIPQLRLLGFPTSFFTTVPGNAINTIPGLGSSIVGQGGLLDATSAGLLSGFNGLGNNTVRNLPRGGLNINSLLRGVSNTVLNSLFSSSLGRLF